MKNFRTHGDSEDGQKPRTQDAYNSHYDAQGRGSGRKATNLLQKNSTRHNLSDSSAAEDSVLFDQVSSGSVVLHPSGESPAKLTRKAVSMTQLSKDAALFITDNFYSEA